MSAMAVTIPRCMPAAITRKLHALAEQRCAYLAELHASGRWTRYYGKEQFIACMAEALELVRVSQSMLRSAEHAPRPATTEQSIPTAN
jgi:hypothetical protein